uniref:Metal-dependent phosphohydrolase n=1 Tax=Ochrobactrum phage ORM_20 TaxID=2985243 RepID=A0A9N6ZGE3_9VIRU|nr:metal-dependent phosphohydrolase [Ochrobactrum phage ORM_20]
MKTPLVNMAMAFSIGAHAGIGQVRRHDNSAYWKHPERVVRLLVSSGITDENVLAAAYLHDTLEDTKVTVQDLQAIFPPEVVKLVLELTDVYQDKRFGNRKLRKEMEAQRLWSISVEAQNVKLADFLDNWSTISTQEPKFAETFAREKRMIISGFKGEVNKKLLESANKEIDTFLQNHVYKSKDA